MNVNWKRTDRSSSVYFTALPVGATFRNRHGYGAVYSKVRNKRTGEEFQLELATGLLFDPTTSPLEEVAVDVNVDADKPTLYR